MPFFFDGTDLFLGNSLEVSLAIIASRSEAIVAWFAIFEASLKSFIGVLHRHFTLHFF